MLNPSTEFTLERSGGLRASSVKYLNVISMNPPIALLFNEMLPGACPEASKGSA